MLEPKRNLYFCGDDLMGRGSYAQNLKKIILECQTYPKSNDNLSYVIGIDAPWGSGKTFFVNMFLNYLQGIWINPALTDEEILAASINTGANVDNNTEKLDVIYYDAWKNDFWDNAFEPLFDQIIQEEKIVHETEKKDILELFQTCGKIIALGLKGVLYKNIEECIETTVLDEIIDEIKKGSANALHTDYQTSQIFPEYTVFCKAINNLRNYLNNSIKKTGQKVIFIDELDRCKPTFAVQTLEIVKHLFNIEGLVFVFSLDIQQLAHSVKAVYGEGFDAVGYLERFFNYLTILPSSNTYSAVQTYFEEFGLGLLDERVKENFYKIFKNFDLSLREIRTVLCAYFVLKKTILKQYKNILNAQILYVYFLTLKYKNPTLFSNAVKFSNLENFINLVSYNRVPFLNISEKAYKSFQSVISKNISIKELNYSIISSKGTVDEIHKQINNLHGTRLIFKNGDQIELSEDISLSLVLFYPDIKEYNKIKKFTALEYISRQLELCDFL